MLAERLLTATVRRANSRSLRLEPYRGGKLPAPTPGKRYMLYVHVPFCQRLCPYCSFNRYPFSGERAHPYFEQLRDEMRMIADQGYDFESMYVGGGTPTVVLEELVKTLDLARELFNIVEVSSETNPNHLLPEYIEELAPRVQRFSVGVQSFDDMLLKQMDRYDKYGSGAETLERIQQAAGAFHSLNVDMIFNFPSQTPEILKRDVELLKQSGCNQTTFYPLMASPVVSQQLARTVGRVDYAREAKYYQQLATDLEETFEAASAWTFSRRAGGMIDEYIVDYDEYVGIGSGAFSYVGGAIYVNTFSLREYGAAHEKGRPPVTAWRRFDTREQMRYRFMMGLFGLKLDKQAFERDFGVPLDRAMRLEMTFMRTVGALADDTAEYATLTEKGRYLLVAMMREFFIGVNSIRDQARAALPDEERRLIFGEGDACASAHPLASAVSETEAAEDSVPRTTLP